MDCQPVSNERGAGTTPAINTDDPDGSDNGGFADSLSAGGYEFYIDASWRIDDGVTNWCMVTHEPDDDGGYRVIGVVGGYAGGGDFAVEPFYYELDKDDPDSSATLVFFEMGAGNLNAITGDEDDRFEPDHQTRDIATAAYIVFKKWHEVDRWLDDNELVLLGEMRSHPDLVRVAEGHTVSLEIHSDVVDGTSTDQMRVMSELGFTRAPTVSSDDEDEVDDDEGNDASITGPETPNGILGLNYILLGRIKTNWPDEDSDHVEPDCLADDEQVRMHIAWAEDQVAIRINEDVAQFRYEPDDENGDRADDSLRDHVRRFLQSHSEWGLDGEVLEEAVTIIMYRGFDDLLDGDEEDRGWRCETGEYRVTGWNGSWGELDEDGGESAYAGGFYLSVVEFTEHNQIADSENLEIARDEDGHIVHMELNAAISDLNHHYFVGVRQKAKAASKPAVIAVATAPLPAPASCVNDGQPVAQAAPPVARPAGTSANWIALIVVASLVLAGLMYAYSKFIATKDEPSQASDISLQPPSPTVDNAPAAAIPVIPADIAPEPPVVSAPASNPSFDCTSASTMIEKTLCTDAALGELDRTLDEKYQRLRGAGIGGDLLLSTQRLWVTERNACTDRNCLAGAYRNRIRELDEYVIGKVRADASVEDAPQPETTQRQVSNPGFDCDLHRSTVEQAICSDAQLGDLHRTMAEKYAALSYAGAGGDVLDASQKFWMEYRNRCTDKACLVEAYTIRIRALDEFADSKR